MATSIRTTCGYCAVGCQIEATRNDDGSIKLKGVAGSPINDGLLCPKGMTSHLPLLAADRAKTAFVRDQRGAAIREISMQQAVKIFVERLKKVQAKYGYDATAFYGTGQFTTEDFAMLGAVGRVGMKMEGDGNTRLCMASAVVAYKQAFGFDAPPFSYDDLRHSDCLIFIGSNPPIAQPILWNMYRKAAVNRDHDLVVIDPRKCEAAKKATQHLALRPKSDLPLLYIIANTLIKKNWIKEDYIAAHTSGFAEFKLAVSDYTIDRSMELCDIPEAELMSLVEKIHNRKRVSFWWTMGVNQSYEGTRIGTTIIALAIMTGNIGRLGTGPNSITGQCNAMGSRIHSNTSCMFGGRDFLNPEHRQETADWLGIDVDRIPQRPTMPISKIIEQIDQGKIKFLWVLATNPLCSTANLDNVKQAFAKLDTLVVQDLYHNTATAQQADLFLPGAGTIEKDGSFISMDRRVNVINKVLDPPGDALTDFDICRLIAVEYGCDDIIKGWDTPDIVFHKLKDFTAGRPCDYTGIKDRKQLAEVGGIQWPFLPGSKLETYRHLFADGKFFTPDGRAKILFDVPQEPPKLSAEYPFAALSGRGSIAFFLTSTRTKRVPSLVKMANPEMYVEMNPKDMAELQLQDGDQIEVSSTVGSVHAGVQASEGLKPKQLFLPIHYTESNFAIISTCDCYSGQPSFKYTPVQVRKAS